MRKYSPFIRYPSFAVFYLITLLYFLGSLTPYITSLHFKGFTYLALFFPFLFIGMVSTFLLSIFLFKKYSIFLLLILLLGYRNIFSTTSFIYPKNFEQQKAPNTFRLLSWNVNDFVTSDKKRDTVGAPRRTILAFIKSVNADILCLQDFSSSERDKYVFSNLEYLKDTLNYPYYYVSSDDSSKGTKYIYGTVILSRFPITDSCRFVYIRKHLPEHLMYATINIKGHPIRFYNTHLQSMFLHRYGRVPYNNEQFILDDTAMIYSGHRYQKLVYFDSIHIGQAKLIKEKLNECTIQYIFCADLNSVPSSYVYQHISTGLNDAFLQKGFGWGTTYEGLSPSLRIDVVLMSKNLKANQYYSPKLQNASDHYPIVTDISLH